MVRFAIWRSFILTPDMCPNIDSVYSLVNLESKLLAYVNNPDAQTEPFDVADIPKISREQAQKEAARKSFQRLACLTKL